MYSDRVCAIWIRKPQGAIGAEAPPPNLGEVEAPLSEVPEALIVLRYNGRWGAYGRKNDPPQGPALHNGWTWPGSSAIRWLLPKDLGN